MHICESVQPNFWEAVEQLVENNMNCDVSNLIDEDEKYCVSSEYSSGLRHVSQYEKDSVTDLAKSIAQQIIDVVSKPVSSVDFFLMSKRLDQLAEHMFYQDARLEK